MEKPILFSYKIDQERRLMKCTASEVITMAQHFCKTLRLTRVSVSWSM
jgi:hypothetical protein